MASLPPSDSAFGKGIIAPMSRESLLALDEWAAMIAGMAEEGGMQEMLDMYDHLDDYINFTVASEEERAQLASEIGLEAYAQLVHEMQRTQRSLGLLAF